MKQKKYLTETQLYVVITHPKVGNIVRNYVEGNITEEIQEYKEIGLCGFGYRLSEEEEDGGVRNWNGRYPYLKHIIELWSGD